MVHEALHWAEGSKTEPSVRACCAPPDFAHKHQWQSERTPEPRCPNGAVAGLAGSVAITRRGDGYEQGILAGGRDGAGAGKPGFGGRHHQDRVCLDVQRPDRRDRQRHAQFVRARARSSRPQDGRQAGRGDLRGRRAEAGRRQAEDREAGPVRQGRLHRRLYLVERAARLAEDRGRFEDFPDLAPMPGLRSSPANCARLTCSRPPGRTTRRPRRWAST